MAYPFYLPEGGADADASSSSAGSSSASSDGGSSVASQSPNTTTSATQTPMQSPMLAADGQLVMAIFEAVQRYSVNSATPVFQYPPPPSPSCTAPSPGYYGGDIFFPHGRSTPRTPRTSVSFAAGEEINFYRQPPTTPQPMPPQSAPPMHHSYQQTTAQHYHHHHQQHAAPHAYASHYAQYTPPPTPTTATTAASTSLPSSSSLSLSLSSSLGGASASANNINNNNNAVHMNGANASAATAGQSTMRLYRSHSDATRRSRLTSTGEDEREYQSDHDTSFDEFDDRYENFTAGRERLQEFNGRIPPRKKKNKETVARPKPEKKEQSFTWPTVVTVFVVAMGCGFLVAR